MSRKDENLIKSNSDNNTNSVISNMLIKTENLYSKYIFPFIFFVGAQLIRNFCSLKRKCHKLGLRCKWFIKRMFMDFKETVYKTYNKSIYSIKQPFIEFKSKLMEVIETVMDDSSKDMPIYKSAWKYRKTILSSASSFKRPVKRMANYILPVFSVFILVFTIHYITTLTFALSVNYNNEKIGYISDESVFNEAEKDVKRRMIYEDKYKQPKDKVPVFELCVVDKSQLTSQDDMSNDIIKASGNEIQNANGLYIDGDFIGATKNGDNLLLALNDIKEQYRTDEKNQVIEFSNKIEVKKGLYPNSSISDLRKIKKKLNSTVEDAVTYTIKSGDTPSGVAQRYGIATSELMAKNADVVRTFLPNQQLTIETAVDRLTVQVSEDEVYEKDIDFGTDEVKSDKYYKGYTKVTKAGVAGKEKITARVTYINGIEVERSILNKTTISEPVNQTKVIGTKIPLYKAPTSKGTNQTFGWPVRGGYISCPWWGYWGHRGTDIAASYGTDVLASAPGIVQYAGWKIGGYGNLVIIDHGNGVQTRYLHNSQIHVTSGQYVAQGQVIASVGRTGNAYGNHCHFEIRFNNVPTNPANYIGSRSPY